MLVTDTGLLCQVDIYVYIHTRRLSDAWMNIREACIGRGESSNRRAVQINGGKKKKKSGCPFDDIYKEAERERRWMQDVSWVESEGAVFIVAASSSHDGQGTDLK